MKYRLSFSSLILSLAFGVSVQAEVQFFSDTAAFSAAAGTLTLQDFNGDFITDATNPNPIDFEHFSVAETDGIPNMHKFESGNFLHFQSDAPSTVTFTFEQAINAFALITVDFARESGLADGVVETVTYADNSASAPQEIVISRESGGGIGVLNFFGVVNTTESFTEVSLTFSTGETSIGPFNGDDVGIENLQFALVPLPPALWLFGTALAGICLKRRNSSTRTS